MSRKLLVIAIAALLAVVMIVPGASTEADAPVQEFEGTTVTIFGAYTDESEVQAFEAGFEDFEAETGIDVVYEGSSDFEVLVNTRVDAGDPPDIAGFPQPGLMCRFVEEAVDLTEFLEQDYVVEQYGQSYYDMGVCQNSDKLIGVFGRVVVKSLVWYSPSMFEDAGYSIPTTWDEMLELSDQIVADGGTPWAAPMESGAATGWVGTDWIEDIMLRTTSVENYDAWSVPASPDDRLLFSSDEVTEAFELMGEVLLNEDYVFGGTSGMLDVAFFDSLVPILEGDVFMVKQGSYAPGWVSGEYPDLEIGPNGDLYYFVFPVIEEEYGTPVLIGGDIYTMFNDRPEVRAVMEHITRGEHLRPGIEEGTFIAPHQDADPDWYREAERGIAEILQNASNARFDASDLQPGEVGTGTFWQGVVDYLSGEDLADILETIDESWPEE